MDSIWIFELIYSGVIAFVLYVYSYMTRKEIKKIKYEMENIKKINDNYQYIIDKILKNNKV